MIYFALAGVPLAFVLGFIVGGLAVQVIVKAEVDALRDELDKYETTNGH